MAKPNIMVVDDEKNICELIRLYLEKEGFAVTIANNGSDAIAMIRQNRPDLVLLDIMMPGMDGYAVLRRLKSNDTTASVPVIFLSAKSEEYDRIYGLEAGADDYIVKPFSVLEVVSRIRAVLRRSGKKRDVELKIENLRLDTDTRRVFVDNNEVRLTNREYQLLRYLMENRGVPVGRDILLNRVWGYEFQGETRTVDVHIRFLRQKLGSAGQLIETVRGMGYRIN